MVKVVGPMMSLDARGQVGKAVVFSIRKGVNYVRQHVKQRRSRSPAQLAHRAVFIDAVAAWKNGTLSTLDKTNWDSYATGTTESGFNRFLRFYLNANYDNATQTKVEPPSIPVPQ